MTIQQRDALYATAKRLLQNAVTDGPERPFGKSFPVPCMMVAALASWVIEEQNRACPACGSEPWVNIDCPACCVASKSQREMWGLDGDDE